MEALLRKLDGESLKACLIMINNGKTYATTGLKKPHGQNRGFGLILRWGLLIDDVQFGGGLDNWGDEISVNGDG